MKNIKKWTVLRITTEEFVVEARTKAEARNKVAKFKTYIPTIDIDVEEADPDEELSP